MGNYRFDMGEWSARFPFVPQKNYWWPDTPPYYEASIITSPIHLCMNERLREAVNDQVEWGKAMPIDVFVMAEGEPADRHITKIGGLPYRPRNKPWPRTAEGQPMTFLAQFCFSDSKDLTGHLPEDVLLIFTPGEGYQESLVFEWYPLGLKNLMDANAAPLPSWRFPPCYGHIFRTVGFPRAKVKPEHYPAYCENGWLTFQGLHVDELQWLFQYQATQIGQAPFLIEFEDAELPIEGRLLCTLNSVQPAATDPFPWVNHPLPLFAKDQRERPGYYDHLTFGDLGSLYFSMTEDGQLHYFESCY